MTPLFFLLLALVASCRSYSGPTGVLVVEGTVDTSKGFEGYPTEGFLWFARVSNEDGEVFDEVVNRRLVRSLPPGTYRLTSYIRPCEGNCDNLESVLAECTTQLRVEARKRVVAHVRIVPQGSCSIQFR